MNDPAFSILATGAIAWQLYMIFRLAKDLRVSNRLHKERRAKWAADDKRLAELERKAGITPLFRIDS